MDSQSLTRFLATVRRTRFIDYLDPIGVTPKQALDQRLRWAARSRTDPQHAEEAAFLLENADALREVVEREVAEGGGEEWAEFHHGPSDRSTWMRRDVTPEQMPPTQPRRDERPPLLTRMEDITPPPMNADEVRRALADPGPLPERPDPTDAPPPPRLAPSFVPVEDDEDPDSTVRIASAFDDADEEDDPDRLATVRMTHAAFDALDEEDAEDNLTTVRMSQAAFGLEDHGTPEPVDDRHRMRERRLPTPTPSMMQRRAQPRKTSKPPRTGVGWALWAIGAAVLLVILVVFGAWAVWHRATILATVATAPAAPAPTPVATNEQSAPGAPAPAIVPAAPAPAPAVAPEKHAPAPAKRASTARKHAPVARRHASTARKHASTARKHASAPRKHAPAPAKPAPATAKPAPATAKPAPTTAKPAPTTAKPAPTTAKPAPATAKEASVAKPPAPASAGPSAKADPVAGKWTGTAGTDGKFTLSLAPGSGGWNGTAIVDMGAGVKKLEVHATWKGTQAVLAGRKGVLFTGFLGTDGGNGTVVLDGVPIRWTVPARPK